MTGFTYTSKGAQALRAAVAKGTPVDWPKIAPLAPGVLRKLRNMTAQNRHGEAYALGAKSLGLDDLALQFEAINREHERLGYLPCLYIRKRASLYNEMIEKAREKLTPEEWKAFYMCF